MARSIQNARHDDFVVALCSHLQGVLHRLLLGDCDLLSPRWLQQCLGAGISLRLAVYCW
jgi:hypothetical protein